MPRKKPSPATPAPPSPEGRTEAVTSPDVPEASFGKRLADLRTAKGLRHDSLSDLTRRVDPQRRGIARTTLRGYELGVYNPGIREIRILSQALGTTPDALVLGSGIDDLTSPGVGSIEDGPAPKVRRDVIAQWAKFGFDMFHLEQSSRETVFRIAGDLTKAQVGAAKYEKWLGAFSEIIELALDGYLDQDPKARVMLPETLLKLEPLIVAVLTKNGFPEAVTSVAADSLRQQAAKMAQHSQSTAPPASSDPPK